MFPGSFAPSLFFRLATYIIIPSLFIVYWISQLNGHEPPFPNSWIRQCAQHYPEFIIYRFANISGAVLVALGWFANYFYLQTIAKENKFNVEKYYPQVSLILGLTGTMLLMCSTATVDTGRLNDRINERLWATCELAYLIFTIAAQVYNTVVFYLLYSNTNAVSYDNLLFKYALVILFAVQGLLSTYQGNLGGFWNITEENRSQAYQLDIFLQWSLTCTIVLGFYSMSLDVKKFALVYESSTLITQQSQKLTEIGEVD